jgi:hypothetical protein
VETFAKALVTVLGLHALGVRCSFGEGEKEPVLWLGRKWSN